MSDKQDGTEWADCVICGLTTNPTANLPGDRDAREVEVRETSEGNASSVTRGVSSTATRSASRIICDGGKGGEWLASNAVPCGEGKWEDSRGTAAWDQARDGLDEAEVSGMNELGRFTVQPADSDSQNVLLVKDGETYAGACSCAGYENGSPPCSHLCTVRLKEWQDAVEVPTSHEYARELLAVSEQSDGFGRASGDERDETEADAGAQTADGQPRSSDGTESEAVMTQSEGAHEAPAPPSESDDAFANPLPEVDDKFVIEMDGSNYVRKAGYARLLRQRGWEVGRDIVKWSHEGDEKRAVVEARIVDPESGRVIAEALGTAGPPEAEDMTGAEYNLDELAETRAWTRAASIATGEGMTALAEIPEHAEQEVDADA